MTYGTSYAGVSFLLGGRNGVVPLKVGVLGDESGSVAGDDPFPTFTTSGLNGT
jgi:hypothetical protein